jgi:type I restriction enzyme M protein
MDAAEYKHVVLGLIFLKFISDAFEAEKPKGAPRGKRSGFWVPAEARWPALAERAHFPEIGARVDAAMVALERSNPSLRDVLPKHYERPDLDKQRLGELIDLISTIGLGDPADRSRDVLGRVYEYFLTSFAAAEGKNGGQFYTPRSVVGLLVAMLAPYKGTVYDPACGSGGLFVQSERFIEEHGGRPGDIRIFGQESNPTTWRLAKMNLALRGIACDLGPEHADSFHRDLHPDLRADYVLANPPFNCRDWGRERLLDDPRWRYGLPPEKSANFAWVQHFIHHLGPRGLAGFVLANGALSSVTAGEGEIRRAIVEDDLIDCMVALPGKLFYSTQIPVSLWFLARDKRDRRFRARAGESLFIDARGLGTMIDRIHRELTEADIEQLTRTYHAWRGDSRRSRPAGAPACSTTSRPTSPTRSSAARSAPSWSAATTPKPACRSSAAPTSAPASAASTPTTSCSSPRPRPTR